MPIEPKCTPYFKFVYPAQLDLLSKRKSSFNSKQRIEDLWPRAKLLDFLSLPAVLLWKLHTNWPPLWTLKGATLCGCVREMSVHTWDVLFFVMLRHFLKIHRSSVLVSVSPTCHVHECLVSLRLSECWNKQQHAFPIVFSLYHGHGRAVSQWHSHYVDAESDDNHQQMNWEPIHQRYFATEHPS